MCLLQKVRLNPKMVLGVAEVPEFFIIEMLYLYFANRHLLWSLYLLSSGSFSNYTFIVYQDWKIVIWWNLYYLMKQHPQLKVRYPLRRIE